jgi:S1-C subfamily serine protease
MLTNKHVVEDYYARCSNDDWKTRLRLDKGILVSEKLWVFVAGERYAASLLHTSPRFDLAIIEVRGIPRKRFRLKLSPTKLVDEEVRAIGFPNNAGIALSEQQVAEKAAKLDELLNRDESIDIKESFLPHQLEFVLTKGTICQVPRDSTNETLWLQHTANIAPGSSGGPLVLSDGSVVGINTLGVGDPGKHGAQFYRALSIGQLRSEIENFAKDTTWVR